MTYDEQRAIQALMTYPEWPVFEKYLDKQLADLRDILVIDTTANMGEQAWGKHYAASTLVSIFNDLRIIASKQTQKPKQDSSE